MQFSIIVTLSLAAVTSTDTQSQRTDGFEAKKHHEQSNCSFECISKSPEYIAIISNNGTNNKGCLADVYKNCRAKCGLTKESFGEIKQPYHFSTDDIDKNLNDTWNKFSDNIKRTGNFDLPKYLGSVGIKDHSKVTEARKKFAENRKSVHPDPAKSKCKRECFNEANKAFTGNDTKDERLSGIQVYSKLVEDCVTKC